jgi:hypothetical protein
MATRKLAGRTKSAKQNPIPSWAEQFHRTARRLLESDKVGEELESTVRTSLGLVATPDGRFEPADGTELHDALHVADLLRNTFPKAGGRMRPQDTVYALAMLADLAATLERVLRSADNAIAYYCADKGVTL